jgi:acyl-coenzyme A synthetase/AMP-(fatty) acid ligase
MYGQTEAAGLLTSKPFDLHAGDVESAGVPLIGVDLRILDAQGRDITASGETGEIRVRAGFTFAVSSKRSDIGAPAVLSAAKV